jgi:tight adherence protein C
LNRRLARAGSDKSPADFRAEQLLWGAAGFVTAVGAVLLSGAAGRFSPLLAVLLVLGGAAGGFMMRDYLLGAQVRKRETRMMAEFPSIAELMALAVSAGESATGALDRVCRSARGELSKDFTRVLAETRAGKPLAEALQEFSSRTELGPLIRFVDGLIVAVERGTPLADVLRAQAQDVRDTAKRDLMESAGKKEIAMMVPVVFGVLPLTVLFAVYPGLAAISMGL